MKRIEIEKTITKVTAVKAIDGTIFYVHDDDIEKAENECREYEESAKGIINGRVREFQIAEGTNYELDPFQMNDDMIEIFLPKTEKEIDYLNQYMMNAVDETTYENNKLDNSFINKEVIIQWNYDKDWFIRKTYEQFVNEFKNNFYKMIAEYKENKNG